MAGVAGKTNNPNGRPAKSRALTDLLVKELSKTFEVGGKKVSGKKVIAEMVVKAIITGRIKFPNDTEDSVISVKDWIEFAKWVYVHVDGTAKSGADDLAENGIRVIVEYANSPIAAPGVSPKPTDNP